MTSMLEKLRRMVTDFFKTRYVGMLEAELLRLRGENRALTNSLLGTAGFPPLDDGFSQMQPVPAVRRRSWQQIQSRQESRTRSGPEENR